MNQLRLVLSVLLLLGLLAPAAFTADPSPYAKKKIETAATRAAANNELYYDEVFDENGAIRPHYRDIFPHFAELNKKRREEIRKGTLKRFEGDNALSPLPLVTPEEEFRRLQAGVAQRGEALLRFLQDHYSGDKSYIRDGIIPEEVIRQIVERSTEAGYEGLVNPDEISFLYGPDIIRDAQGVFRVLEDNTGFLGGQGDIIEARESLRAFMPEMMKELEGQTHDPRNFYDELYQRYRGEMKNPKEKMIVFAVPPYADMEDNRLRQIWESFGVEWVTPYGKKRITQKPDGLYLRWKEGGRELEEKVGFIIMNSDHHDADPSHPVAREKWLRNWAEYILSEENGDNAEVEQVRKALRPDPKTGRVDYAKLERHLRGLAKLRTVGGKGIIEASLKGQVRTNTGPATEFINDKEFNLYVEDLIRYYLKEEPILRNFPTKRIYTTDARGQRVPDETVFADLEANRSKYVLKVVDGRGGDGVHVGPKTSPEKWKKILVDLRRSPDREVIAQQYGHPSVLGDDIVDRRIYAQVSARLDESGKYPGVFVPNHGWSRGALMAGDGKVNLSAGRAHEVAFIVRKSPGTESEPSPRARWQPEDCQGHFRGISP
jgi:uncharacterized circularly permuted ATP-grasp superfamily protein